MKLVERKARLLEKWKARQEAEGIDVSMVTTLEEADRFYDNYKPSKKVEKKEETSYKELQAKAKELGIKYTGVSKEDLIKNIDIALTKTDDIIELDNKEDVIEEDDTITTDVAEESNEETKTDVEVSTEEQMPEEPLNVTEE